YVLPIFFCNHNCEDSNTKLINLTYAFHHQLIELYSSLLPLLNEIVTLVPFPNSLRTSTLPPWDSIISLTIANPNPAPPLFRDLDFSTLYKRSNIFGRSSFGIPSPSSVIIIFVT